MEQHIQQLMKELSDVKQQMKTMKQELNRQSQRLSVGGCIALMQALCFDFHVDHSF